MSAIFTEPALVALVLAIIASAVPLMLAAAGETVGEQAGMLNIGMDGVMLVGGYFAFAATLATGSFWIGAISGLLAGVALSSIMMVLCVWLGVNQIVVGIGIGLAGTGISGVLYDYSFADTKPRLGLDAPWSVPVLSDLPVLGLSLFSQPGLFTVAIAIVVLTSAWLHRTLPGLRLRAAGQNPATLDAAGGNVRLIRSGAVLFGGAMSGLGGAYLSLISAGTFTPGMTHGVGFLAIVVAMLARGRMRWVVTISVLYGVCVAAGTALQITGREIPADVIHMLPFIAVLVVLVCVPKRSMLPPALAVAYVRGARG